MSGMKVLKFGGTSVGSAARMRDVANLISNETSQQIVVLSAMSGTTNTLVSIAESLDQGKQKEALEEITNLKAQYNTLLHALFNEVFYHNEARGLLDEHFNYISGFASGEFTSFDERALLAEGELLSTGLFNLLLSQMGIKSVLIPALEFMRIDRAGEPDMYYIAKNLNQELEKHSDTTLFITQGFICRNAYGEIDNLNRGGSDYTASIIGAALKAAEIQIWTDIDGMHNNDPRIVENTESVRQLSFDEAAELAYFGAKILHPLSVHPAKEHNIPVLLKNTMDPAALGTRIEASAPYAPIKAIAAKDGITAIKIRSARMLLAHGFLRKVFEVFENFETSIDMITTSEVSISLTIDDTTNLSPIVAELLNYGQVEVDSNLSIVCVVGDMLAEDSGSCARILDALRDIPVRMISYGGSKNNVSLLVQERHKKEALQALHQGIFQFELTHA